MEKCRFGICDGSGTVGSDDPEEGDKTCECKKAERIENEGENQSDAERGN